MNLWDKGTEKFVDMQVFVYLCRRNKKHMQTAIVLSLTKYSDNGTIVHLYTADQGRMQYAMYGNKYKSIFRPLSIVEYVVSRKNNAPSHICAISSATLLYTPQRIPIDVRRQCVAMFIAEILLYTLRHPMSDQPLFDWLCSIIRHLDTDLDISNLHLQFLIEYASYLGIGIDDAEHPDWYVAPTSRGERQQRLRELCAYYAEHIEDFPSPKSLDILMEVFD